MKTFLLSFFILFAVSAVADEEVFIADFQNINGIGIGTPVLHKGEAVGKVLAIRPALSDQERSGYEITLGLDKSHAEKVRPGTVALSVMSRKDGLSVVELFVPTKSPKIAKGRKRIQGFSSFEQFGSPISAARTVTLFFEDFL